MAKYHLYWRLNEARIPVDAKERGGAWRLMMALIKQDMDETLPGPWEWDLKRLAASFFIAGRFNGLDKKASRKLSRRVAKTYRKSMAELARMRTMDVWYSLVEAQDGVERVADKKTRRKGRKRSRKP